MMQRIIFPGSFDPITLGHEDLIHRASRICHHLMIVVAQNLSKSCLLTIDQRVDLVKKVTRDYSNVEVARCDGLLMDFVEKQPKPWVLLRGVRSINDYIYEHDRAMMNQCLLPDVETVFLPSTPRYSSLSSTLVREINSLNGALDGFVSREVINTLRA